MASVFENTRALGKWVGGESIFFRPLEGRSQFRDAERDARSIQMLGEVRKPGLVLFKPGMDFLYYLSQSEGPTAAADLEHIDIVRGAVPNAESIQVKWSETNQLPQLQAGDMVVDRSKEPTPLERSMPIITGLSSVLGTILLFIIVL